MEGSWGIPKSVGLSKGRQAARRRGIAAAAAAAAQGPRAPAARMPAGLCVSEMHAVVSGEKVLQGFVLEEGRPERGILR